jgi:hypothetical protein
MRAHRKMEELARANEGLLFFAKSQSNRMTEKALRGYGEKGMAISEQRRTLSRSIGLPGCDHARFLLSSFSSHFRYLK